MDKDLIKNAVFAESALKDYMYRHRMAQESEILDQLNDLLYKTAKEHGVSLYQLCSSVVPDFSYDIKENPYEGGLKMVMETTITLKPISR
jgi:hypothetical protein